MRKIILLFICFLLSACSAYEAIKVATTDGEYQVLPQTRHGVSIQQRYSGEYHALGNPVTYVFSSIDRSNAYVRHHYKLSSNDKSRFDKFTATFHYKCDYGWSKDIVNFSKQDYDIEKKGSRLPEGKCSNRPTDFSIKISDDMYNSPAYVRNSKGTVFLGWHQKGRLVKGAIIREDGSYDIGRWNSKGKAYGQRVSKQSNGIVNLVNTNDKGQYTGDSITIYPSGDTRLSVYKDGYNRTDSTLTSITNERLKSIEAKEMQSVLHPRTEKIERLTSHQINLLQGKKSSFSAFKSQYGNASVDACRCHTTQICLNVAEKYRGQFDSDREYSNYLARYERGQARSKVLRGVCRKAYKAGILLSEGQTIEDMLRNTIKNTEMGPDLLQLFEKAKQDLKESDEIGRKIIQEQKQLEQKRKYVLQKQASERKQKRQKVKQKIELERANRKQKALAKHKQWRQCIRSKYGMDPDNTRNWKAWPEGC